MLWEQRPIVEKHHRYALYRPSADAIASMICDLPNKILTSLLFNIPLYLMTNLRRTPEAFFTYILFSFTCLLTMSMIFRTIGSVSRTLAWSMAPAAVLMLLLMIYTGFTLPLPYMNPWLRWFNYVNPVAYTFESLMVNEVCIAYGFVLTIRQFLNDFQVSRALFSVFNFCPSRTFLYQYRRSTEDL